MACGMLPSFHKLRLHCVPVGAPLNSATWGPDAVCSICEESLAQDSTATPWPASQENFTMVACVNGHVFHKGCLLRWLRSANSEGRCPDCMLPAFQDMEARLREQAPPEPAPEPVPALAVLAAAAAPTPLPPPEPDPNPEVQLQRARNQLAESMQELVLEQLRRAQQRLELARAQSEGMNPRAVRGFLRQLQASADLWRTAFNDALWLLRIAYRLPDDGNPDGRPIEFQDALRAARASERAAELADPQIDAPEDAGEEMRRVHSPPARSRRQRSALAPNPFDEGGGDDDEEGEEDAASRNLRELNEYARRPRAEDYPELREETDDEEEEEEDIPLARRQRR